MDHFEMTEKLREKVNVSYEEAKAALEANDWDLLESIIYLENHGKQAYARPSGTAEQHGREQTAQAEQQYKARAQERRMEREKQVSGVLQGIIGFCTRLLEKGNRNALEIYRHGRLLLSVPLTILILLIVFGFWFVVPALFLGLFFGLRYRFAGQDISQKFNDAMDSVANKAEDFKENLQKKPENRE